MSYCVLSAHKHVTHTFKTRHTGVLAAWYVRMYLLDVVQTSRVWFENGGVMEHLIKSDTEEDYIQLKHTDRDTHKLIFFGDKPD